VGVAATPTGRGYWLAAADGGVFSFGDARFQGSTGGLDLASEIVGIAATPTGDGYWLAARDGGVSAFGDADYAGAPSEFGVDEPIVAIDASPTRGYVLAGAHGGVFAFGGAPYVGAAHAAGMPDVTGISFDRDGRGYVVVRRDGSVYALGARYAGGASDATAGAHTVPNVDIAVSPAGGYWIVQSDVIPPPAPARRVDPNHPFLVCTRAHESDSSGGYRAVSASGTYRGAYQFSQSTWNSTALHAGRPELVGVDPASAAPQDQDHLALVLYQWQGASPWLGRCAGL
jgi:hypothetical protein